MHPVSMQAMRDEFEKIAVTERFIGKHVASWASKQNPKNTGEALKGISRLSRTNLRAEARAASKGASLAKTKGSTPMRDMGGGTHLQPETHKAFSSGFSSIMAKGRKLGLPKPGDVAGLKNRHKIRAKDMRATGLGREIAGGRSAGLVGD